MKTVVRWHVIILTYVCQLDQLYHLQMLVVLFCSYQYKYLMRNYFCVKILSYRQTGSIEQLQVPCLMMFLADRFVLPKQCIDFN